MNSQNPQHSPNPLANMDPISQYQDMKHNILELNKKFNSIIGMVKPVVKGGLKQSKPTGEPNRYWIKVSCDTEGELIINDLVDCYENGETYEKVSGIWTWDELGEPISTGMRIPQKDLTVIPNAIWDGVDLDSYAQFHYEGHMHLPLQGSRGCTYKCTFCSETRIFRFRKGSDIKNEVLEQVDKYGVTHFSFVDSLVNGSMPQFKIFVDEMAKEVDKDSRGVLLNTK